MTFRRLDCSYGSCWALSSADAGKSPAGCHRIFREASEQSQNLRDIGGDSTNAAAMFWKFLLLASLLPLAVCLGARWWFGLRVLLQSGGQPCRCDLTRWSPPTDNEVIQRAEQSAYEFGRQLRLTALEEWRKDDPKAERTRASSKRFGMAVPPLSGVIVIMAVVVAKIPVIGAISCFLIATALAAVFGILALAPELAAINRTARKLRQTRCFPRRDDEEAVVRCAVAHCWKETLPPLLAMMQR